MSWPKSCHILIVFSCLYNIYFERKVKYNVANTFGVIIAIIKTLLNVSCEFINFLALLFVFISAHLISQSLSTRINKYTYFKVERQNCLPIHLYSV